MVVVLHGPHFLPSERRMLRWLNDELRPPLPVVSPYLQNGFFERPRGERIKDGVKGAVDGENKYDHPGANSTCRDQNTQTRRGKISKLALNSYLNILNL